MGTCSAKSVGAEQRIGHERGEIAVGDADGEKVDEPYVQLRVQRPRQADDADHEADVHRGALRGVERARLRLG